MEREIKVIERDGAGRQREWRLVRGGINTAWLVFIAAEDCDVAIGHIKTQGHVRAVSEATRP